MPINSVPSAPPATLNADRSEEGRHRTVPHALNSTLSKIRRRRRAVRRSGRRGRWEVFGCRCFLPTCKKPVAARGSGAPGRARPRRWAPSFGTRLPAARRSATGSTLHEERDEREERQAQRRGARDGQVVPLALAFDAQVSAGFLEGGFHRPAAHEGVDDGGGFQSRVGGEQGLRLAPTPGIAHEHPAWGHRGAVRCGTTRPGRWPPPANATRRRTSAPAPASRRCPFG